MVPVRERLLDAGQALLVEDGFKVLNRGLNVAEIAARAEVSEKTFFATFGDKGRYVEELLVRFNRPPAPRAGTVVDVVEQALAETKGDPRRLLRTVSTWNYELLRADPATLMQLATVVLGRGHQGAMRRLRQTYAAYDQAGVRVYRSMLARWSASLRAPFTPEQLAVVLTALVEGLFLRHLADPDAVPDTLLGDTVVALVGALLDPEQGHGHVDDAIAPLADEVVRAYRVDRLDGLPDNPRNAVIAAARHEFAARGYYATTPDHIAARAGVPLTVLRQLFPVKASIVVGALRPGCGELRSLLDDDLALGVAPRHLLRRHLERLAAFTLGNREFAEALVMAVVHDTATDDTTDGISREIDLAGMLVPVIEAGRARGDFGADHDPATLARALTDSTLLHCLTHRDGTAADHVDAVEALALHGLLARAAPDAPPGR
ncbi:TetR/AcrR family transcriptional regulator [Saccharothrix longispora]|uniref:AcrR family transcriptional regulator n=1 Tax=Saccharothrix longispora TaxID=33920 RepID=A0ABU1PT35_9PSEU|nr:TetR/AcrR family transcriptional regulator [Saccharothrix longispora]MDR6593756.1 AcrR family transcriptional regulator [Saccharothrix longispora]